jgi:hypothetical protein
MATTQCYVGGLELNSTLYFHPCRCMQTVNRGSRNAKTLKLHSEVGFAHEGAEVRTTSRNSPSLKLAEVASTSASSASPELAAVCSRWVDRCA